MAPQPVSRLFAWVGLLSLVSNVARAEEPQFRVGMKVVQRSPEIILKNGETTVLLATTSISTRSNKSQATSFAWLTGELSASPQPGSSFHSTGPPPISPRGSKRSHARHSAISNERWHENTRMNSRVR